MKLAVVVLNGFFFYRFKKELWTKLFTPIAVGPRRMAPENEAHAVVNLSSASNNLYSEGQEESHE